MPLTLVYCFKCSSVPIKKHCINILAPSSHCLLAAAVPDAPRFARTATLKVNFQVLTSCLTAAVDCAAACDIVREFVDCYKLRGAWCAGAAELK